MDFKLPELGENIVSGDVVKVLVHEGDVIAPNDGIIELETDKAVVEIPCPHGGRISKMHVKQGDTVKVGQTLVTVESAEKPDTGKASATPAATGKAGTSGATGSASAAPEKTTQPATGKASATPATSYEDTGLPAGPAVRRLARELGVDLMQVQGSGKHGRITVEDVQASVAAGLTGTASATPSGPTGKASTTPRATGSASAATRHPPLATSAAPVVPPGEAGRDDYGEIRTERLSRIRRTIAEQMVRSASTIPHVTAFDDADVTDLERLRQGVPPGYLGPNLKLTMLPFVMRAVAIALRRHPALNAVFDQEHEQVIYKQYVNLGIAVDTPRGLVVPNVRQADSLGIGQLAEALAGIAARARASQFAVEELRGGTFTISNLGAVGGGYSTPIINFPEVAILLLGRARWQPRVCGENHDKVEIRLVMPLSLSYDHRLVDGATAGRFLNEVLELLQNPGRLVL
jgi:pyruvate dehydrogenase E2 component (dihydrolipoamide acetyltransferase)